MNSISRSEDDQQLRRFFAQLLVPMAEKLREESVRFFALAPEDNGDSWYVPYPKDMPELVSFESADTQRELRELWERQGLSALMPLAAPLAALARELEMPTPGDDADVSPFIYVMF